MGDDHDLNADTSPENGNTAYTSASGSNVDGKVYLEGGATQRQSVGPNQTFIDAGTSLRFLPSRPTLTC